MRWLNIVWGLVFASLQALACDVVDDTGQHIRLAHPAQRIVSLAPDLTELVFAVGAGDHLVGVVQGSDYPPAAKTIPSVGNYAHINLEFILASHPDLIVAWTETRGVHALRRLGIPVYLSHPTQLTDVPVTLKRLGCLTGHELLATQRADLFLQRYAAIKKLYSTKKTISVFYQISRSPLMTVGQTSWINQMIVDCGGRNIFSDLKSPAPSVSREAVIIANPDVMIGNDLSFWRRGSHLRAVESQQLYDINPDLVERAGPRLIQGFKILCRLIDQGRKHPSL